MPRAPCQADLETGQTGRRAGGQASHRAVGCAVGQVRGWKGKC